MLKIVRWYLDNELRNYNYLIVNHTTKSAIAIDPLDYKRYNRYLKDHKLSLEAIFLTHSHHDHVGGVSELYREHNPKIYSGFEHPGFPIDFIVNEDRKINTNTTECQFFLTPGHTSDHLSFYFENIKAIFCGDTLFNGGVGNINDPTGNIDSLLYSVNKIKNLPSDTLIYSGHDYMLKNLLFGLSILPEDSFLLDYYNKFKNFSGEYSPINSIADELKINLFLRLDDKSLQAIVGEKDFELFKYLRIKRNSF